MKKVLCLVLGVGFLNGANQQKIEDFIAATAVGNLSSVQSTFEPELIECCKIDKGTPLYAAAVGIC